MNLDSATQAACVLMSLDNVTAAKVLGHLDPDEVARLSSIMATLDQERPQQAEIAEVLRTFVVLLKSGAADQLGAGGLGANEAIDEERGDVADADPHHEALTILSEMDASELAVIVAGEHPQVGALILEQLPPVRAADVLARLEEPLRVELLMRIARTDPAGAEAFARVAPLLAKRVRGRKSSAHGDKDKEEEGDRYKIVADIIKHLRSEESDPLEQLQEIDAEIAEQVKGRLFVFDDLAAMDSRAMQKVLAQVDSRLVALALKAASPEVSEALLSNLSKRARDMVLEEREALGPVPLSDVRDAQAQIIDVVLKLAEQGEIRVASGGDSEMVQ